MRLSSIQWLLCAASSTASAASAAAKVYLYDHDAPLQASASPETVDPATARLILAQRLDLSQFHTIENADEEAIRQINAFGANQQSLFSHDRQTESTSKIMIVVEGLQDTSISTLGKFESFSIAPAPHPSDSFELFNTLSSEASDLPLTDGPDYHILRALSPLSELAGNTLNAYKNRRTLLHVKTEDAEILDSVVTELEAIAKTHGLIVSLLFTPPSHLSSKPSKTPYGLSKRSAKAQRAQPEQPLISDQKAPAKSAAAPISPARATKVLSGAIPTCFSSLSACQRGTNNCTGHGDCILKWKSETLNEGGSGSKQDCFGCACTKPDVRTNKDGTKKTTNFGGAACHKKDIVFPFWLLAGTTIFIVFIISWGVGLLYEMGNQELPSVIGAGVSGPKPR